MSEPVEVGITPEQLARLKELRQRQCEVVIPPQAVDLEEALEQVEADRDNWKMRCLAAEAEVDRLKDDIAHLRHEIVMLREGLEWA